MRRSLIASFLGSLAVSVAALASTPKSLHFSPAPGEPGFTPGFYVTASGEASEAKAIVADLKKVITADGAIRVPVRWGSEAPAELTAAKASGKYKYWVSYGVQPDGMRTLKVRAWIRDRDTDPEVTGWKVGRLRPRLLACRLLQRYLRTAAAQPRFYAVALSVGALQSKQIEHRDSKFFDRKTGRELSVEEALEIFKKESPRNRHWLRMLSEVSLLFGIQSANYWYYWKASTIDFRYDMGWHWVHDRFFSLDAWTLDDNIFFYNSWRHTMQGAMNYLFGRINGFSTLESYLIAVVMSGMWEFLGEWKEEVSINDMITTPGAGFAVGESVNVIGRFLLRNRHLTRHLGARFGGVDGVHAWVARNTPKLGLKPSALGFDETVWHQFRAVLESNGQVSGFRIDGEVIDIPGLEEPGSENRLLEDGSVARILTTREWGPDGLLDWRLQMKAALLTYLSKRVDSDGNGRVLMLSLSSQYHHGKHYTPDRDTHRTQDWMTVASILGPTVDLTLYRGGLRLRMVIDVYGDFAFVRNYAIDRARAENPDLAVRSTITRDNYHHAFGLTAQGRLVANYGNLEAGFEVQGDLLKSIDIWDPTPATRTVPASSYLSYSLYDSRQQGRAWLGYRTEAADGVFMRFELSHEERRRSGEVLGVRESDREGRTLGGIGIDF